MHLIRPPTTPFPRLTQRARIILFSASSCRVVHLMCEYVCLMINSHRTVHVPSVLAADLLSLPCRWMKKPRCGVPDQIGGAAKFSVRKRRYALTGQKWQHKHITYRWVVHQLNTEALAIKKHLVRSLRSPHPTHPGPTCAHMYKHRLSTSREPRTRCKNKHVNKTNPARASSPGEMTDPSSHSRTHQRGHTDSSRTSTGCH